MPVVSQSTRHFNAASGAASVTAGLAAASGAASAVSVSGLGSGAPWVHRSAGTAPQNGTVNHTITFATDGNAPFTPTAGNFLVGIAAGAVTTAWEAGWTERLEPINNSELSVATATASSATSVTLGHNASNYPINWVIYEFPATMSWVSGVGVAGQINTANQPTLSGLPGTPVTVFYAVSQVIPAGTGSAVSATWGVTEDVDLFTDGVSTVDGVWLSIGYQNNVTATSATTTPTLTNGRASGTERVTFALNVPASGFGVAAFGTAGFGS